MHCKYTVKSYNIHNHSYMKITIHLYQCHLITTICIDTSTYTSYTEDVMYIDIYLLFTTANFSVKNTWQSYTSQSPALCCGQGSYSTRQLLFFALFSMCCSCVFPCFSRSIVFICLPLNHKRKRNLEQSSGKLLSPHWLLTYESYFHLYYMQI